MPLVIHKVAIQVYHLAFFPAQSRLDSIPPQPPKLKAGTPHLPATNITKSGIILTAHLTTYSVFSNVIVLTPGCMLKYFFFNA
jgi:hypothetical protein